MNSAQHGDDTAMFERASAHLENGPHYLLRLFVTGSTARSLRAIRNIRAICEERLRGRYLLEVIDIYEHPEQIRPEEIVVTPTLVKKLPEPVRKIIGDLSNKQRVLAGLNIVSRQTPTAKS